MNSPAQPREFACRRRRGAGETRARTAGLLLKVMLKRQFNSGDSWTLPPETDNG
jgi:hypothetical protein